MSDINVLPLFSTPVMYEYKTDYKISQREKDILYAQDEQTNYGNSLSKNTYVLDNPELANLKSFLQSKLDYYAKNIVAVEDYNFYITNSWTTRNKTGEEHHAHRHPNSMLSGVYYLEADGDSSASLDGFILYNSLLFPFFELIFLYNSESLYSFRLAFILLKDTS